MTQSVISAYESGARQPSLPTLAALIEATGHALDIAVRRPRTPLANLSGPVGRRVRKHRARLVEIAANHGVSNLRVFGSVARAEDQPDSDVDLLVDVAPGVGLFQLAWLQRELEDVLQSQVDLVPADGLKPGVRADIGSHQVAL